MTRRHSRWIVASAFALAVTNAFAGQITLYERPDFQGRYVVATGGIPVVQGQGFGSTASSIVVVDGTWEVCSDVNFNGRCAQLAPGNYSGIDLKLNGRIASVRPIGYANDPRPVAIAPLPYAAPLHYAAPQPYANPVPAVVNPPLVTGRALLYELPNFGGAWVAFDRGEANDLDWAHFSNPLHRAVSIRVEAGSFLFCTDMAFQGECRVLGPGNYPSLPGPLITGISSARQVGYPEYGARDVYRR